MQRKPPRFFSSAAGFSPVAWPMVLVAMLGQLVLVVSTFAKVLLHPGQYLLVDHYDGIKSYFSMACFLRQPLDHSLLVHGHNYPFGEYIFYTASSTTSQLGSARLRRTGTSSPAEITSPLNINTSNR